MKTGKADYVVKGNFFDTKKAYGGKWQPVDERKFTDEEKAMIKAASEKIPVFFSANRNAAF